MKIKYWLYNFIMVSSLCSVILAEEGEFIGKITLILGKVYVKSSLDSSWSIAKLNSNVSQNTILKTAKRSRAEISVNSSQIIRIGENTVTQITKELNRVQVKSDRGKTWLNVILFGDQDFIIKTPTAVAAIRGTVYRVNCDSSSSMFRVYEGTVAVRPGDTTADSVFLVTKGKEFVLTRDVDAYIKSEKQAIQNYTEDQEALFNEFRKQEQEQLLEYQQKDRQAFNQFNDMNFRLMDFDAAKDSLNDWVRWNLALDSLVSR